MHLVNFSIVKSYNICALDLAHILAHPQSSVLHKFTFLTVQITFFKRDLADFDVFKLEFSLSNFYMKESLHCNEYPIYAFLEKELRDLSPNFHIYVSVSDIYTVFPESVYIFSCSRIDRPIVGIYKSLTDTSM
jgi:hypothetical protein